MYFYCKGFLRWETSIEPYEVDVCDMGFALSALYTHKENNRWTDDDIVELFNEMIRMFVNVYAGKHALFSV